MSDFLDNLIARSLDRLEVAQPRLASLFEPPLFTAAHPFEQESGGERPADSFASEEVDPSPRRSAATRTPLHLPKARPAKEDALDETAAARDHAQLLVTPPEKPVRHRTIAPPLPPDQSELRPSPAGSPERPATQRPKDSPPPPRPGMPEAMPAPPPVQRPAIGTESQQTNVSGSRLALESASTAPDRTGIHSEEGARRPLLPLADARRPVEQMAAPTKAAPQSPGDALAQSSPRKESLAARQTVIEAPARPVVVERLASSQKETADPPRAESSPSPFKLVPVAPVPQPIIVQPLVKKHAPPSALRPDELAATPEETPTIQVTIGRIEVRAAPRSETRAPAGSPAPPLMSLNDYLRQRAKGGAR